MMENLHESCEPMEVDLSTNSNQMDVSSESPYIHRRSVPTTSIFEEFDANSRHQSNNVKKMRQSSVEREEIKDQVTSVVKKYHINIQRTKKSEDFSRIGTTIIAIFIAFILYKIANVKCINKLEASDVKETLSNKLYGQDEAIEQIVETLETADRSKILILYGGTGVGKTYSVSLMLQNVWDSFNIHHFTSSSFAETFSPELNIGMTMCKSSIYVIDDLNVKDVHIGNTIRDIIAKSENLNAELLIILIFNCDSKGSEYLEKCDDSFLKELDSRFSDVYAFKKFVSFNTLTKEHLQKCVQSELGGEQYKVQSFKKFLKNFNVERDGCKGVHTKMKVLKIL